MSTVATILDFLEKRTGIDADDADRTHLYTALNRAIRVIAKRLYWRKSDIIQGELSVSLWAEVTATGTDIAFVDSNPDTITSTTTDFVDEGFVAGMHITTDSTTNPGPFEIASVATNAITLISTDSVTTEAAGSSITITSNDDFGDLPTDFWGLRTRPNINGKTWELLPLPSRNTALSYTTAGTPHYYKIKGMRLYVYSPTASDITINGDYFVRPTALSAETDTIPWNELFDDAIEEYLIRFYQEFWEEEATKPEDFFALDKFLYEAVDSVIVERDQEAPTEMPSGIDWEGYL